MAENVVRYGVGWLGQTYKNQTMVDALESWMEEHLEMTSSKTTLGEGFYVVLTSTQAGQLSQFSHCRGDAFDIACPRDADGRIDEARVTAIKKTIERAPINLGLQLVLTREGDHRVIHAQFQHAVEV